MVQGPCTMCFRMAAGAMWVVPSAGASPDGDWGTTCWFNIDWS
jgi:hypothetical protein